jgi:hypothetical protein
MSSDTIVLISVSVAVASVIALVFVLLQRPKKSGGKLLGKVNSIFILFFLILLFLSVLFFDEIIMCIEIQ